MGASLTVLLVDWRTLVDARNRRVAKKTAWLEKKLQEDPAKADAARVLLEATRRGGAGRILDDAWRAAVGASPNRSQPIRTAWFAEYPDLGYPGAGKDLAALDRVWKVMRERIDEADRDHFDPWFRGIGWRDDEDLYRDMEVTFDPLSGGKTLVLSPETIDEAIAAWRGDLVHRWQRLRSFYYRERFTSFDELTRFVVRWIDAFEVARREKRAIVGCWTP